MSVVVRMEMPKNNCEMAVEIKGTGDWCPVEARVCDYYSTKKMPPWCPIVCQLPEGHGRLIDGSNLAEKHRKLAYEDNNKYGFHITAKAWVEESITIVPEEK